MEKKEQIIKYMDPEKMIKDIREYVAKTGEKILIEDSPFHGYVGYTTDDCSKHWRISFNDLMGFYKTGAKFKKVMPLKAWWRKRGEGIEDIDSISSRLKIINCVLEPN